MYSYKQKFPEKDCAAKVSAKSVAILRLSRPAPVQKLSVRKNLLFTAGFFLCIVWLEFNFWKRRCVIIGKLWLFEPVRLEYTRQRPRFGHKDYELVWQEEFEAPALNKKVWHPCDEMNSPELIRESLDPKNQQLENSCLVMRALREEGESPAFSTCATLTTRASMCFRYGYLEIRARVPFQKGAWPAIWAKTKKKYASADYMAAVDILAVYATEREYFVALHKWDKWTHEEVTEWDERRYCFPPAANPGDFHIYGFEWTPESMSFSCDGTVFYTHDITPGGDFGGNIPGMDGFHDPMYLFISNFLFVEGMWWTPGQPFWVDGSTPFPVEFAVDYIHLFQKPGVGDLFNVDSDEK